MQKKISHILEGREKRITDDETVLQVLPTKEFRFANPFIVLHHIRPKMIAAGSATRIHPHPHRGFAPVTFQLRGTGYHKDNAGHEGLVHEGGVQWMFSGSGLLHSEGPAPEFARKGGVYELLQLWVNVPAKYKKDPPSYQSAERDGLPLLSTQPGVALRLVAGDYEDEVGPMKSYSPLVAITGTIAAGKQIQLTATPGYWTLLYLAHGQVQINCETISGYRLIIFEKDNDEVILSALEDSEILYLSALPIDEPLAVKDNFVMNTPAEIEQAIADAKNGGFGTLNF